MRSTCGDRGKEELVVSVYVDDLIITDTRVEDIDNFKRKMMAHFRMSDLGALSYYLGIEVRQGKEELTLGQSAHTHSTSTSVGRSSAEKMAKLNLLSLLSCSGKLYI